ncbi:MAG: DUF2029 domain-containing protein, partial [Candidatus Electrothrix sp. AR3]|nr:DUF2029 domain-containing protein [Candidatus Electrothrix sp. AR3]
TAALLLLFHWLETGYLKKYLLLAGICCGLALGTKYNGLLVLFILSFMVPLLLLRSREQEEKSAGTAIRAAFFFCFVALLTASPWLIRNTIWTGNPVYPLYNGLFNPSSQVNEKTVNKTAVQGVFAKRYVLYRENIWQLLFLPVRIFLKAEMMILVILMVALILFFFCSPLQSFYLEQNLSDWFILNR